MGLFNLKNKRKSKVSTEDATVVGDITKEQSMFPATTDQEVGTEPDKTAAPINNTDPTPSTFSAEEGENDAPATEPAAEAKTDAEDAKVLAEDAEEKVTEEAELDDAQKADLADTAERLETAVDTVKEIVSDMQDQVAAENGEVPESTIKNAELAIECLMRMCDFDNSIYIGLESYADRAAFVISRGNIFINTANGLISRIKKCVK